eukprot:CAMPEP_0118940238 /NCGR_PEP_ID=MMETSP1169-20130426/30919_1 /TAXON_ID=36882 /ORGANISM="Pyramimonas obovata, Strain CCMP722" /LENGTH=219 /DNA_ID=CAMNT_0006884675 /DNA_START=106 /DNA_END=762 /DNA_ORIENTATION=-
MDEADLSRAKAATAAILAKPKLSITLRKNPSILSSKSSSNATANPYIEKPPREGTRWGKNWLKDANLRKGRSLAYQTRAEQLLTILAQPKLEMKPEHERSPSPEPVYDAVGQRKNTREVRMRDALDLERKHCLTEAVQLNPSFKPPVGFKPLLKDAKLFIPLKQYPGYNFIGMILGPRGNTQKRMEAATGTKIALRGKGAVKEGKPTLRKDGKEPEGAN